MKKLKIYYSGIKGINFPFCAYIFLGAFLLSSSAILSQNADFSGTWSLNKNKSQSGEGGARGGAAVKLAIEQEGNNLSIDRTNLRRSGEEFTVSEKYTLDGKECENTLFRRTKKSTATWSGDGKSLTISSTMVFEREGQQMEINTTEIFTLANSGSSLSINYTAKSARGERKNIFIYDKQ